jgi:hypothetical protein
MSWNTNIGYLPGVLPNDFYYAMKFYDDFVRVPVTGSNNTKKDKDFRLLSLSFFYSLFFLSLCY